LAELAFLTETIKVDPFSQNGLARISSANNTISRVLSDINTAFVNPVSGNALVSLNKLKKKGPIQTETISTNSTFFANSIYGKRIDVDTSAGNVQVTIDLPGSNRGFYCSVRKISSDNNLVTFRLLDDNGTESSILFQSSPIFTGATVPNTIGRQYAAVFIQYLGNDFVLREGFTAGSWYSLSGGISL